MKRYELMTDLSLERVWEKLMAMSKEPVHGQMGARAYKLTIKPLEGHNFCALLDIWKLADPDAYGWPIDSKRNKYETQLQFQGTIEPMGFGSKIVGKFQTSIRNVIIYIAVSLGLAAMFAMKRQEFRRPPVILGFAVAATIFCVIGEKRGIDGFRDRREWFIHVLKDNL